MFSKRKMVVLAMVLVGLIGLGIAAPGYVSVSVTGGAGGDVHVEQAGFGPQRLRVVTSVGIVESQTR